MKPRERLRRFQDFMCRRQDLNLRPWPYEDPALTTELRRHFYVAGAGIAPASRGYGPRKILLLHPARGAFLRAT